MAALSEAGGHPEEPVAKPPELPGARRSYVPLGRQLALINSIAVVVAGVLTVLVLAPRHLGSIAWEEPLILAGTLAVLAILNTLALRRAVAPLERLTVLTRSVDPASPHARVTLSGPASEATELAAAFNDMLERLEGERNARTGAILAAQEAERLRVARELHDEVGQALTALLLQLSQAVRAADLGSTPPLLEAQETARASLDEVRRIALELRPEGLDDLGLPSALEALCDRLGERVGLRLVRRVSRELPQLSDDAELVVYRVAQEALTNVARHSGATTARLELSATARGVSLVVADEGCGLRAGSSGGTGMRGMRERAALVGAALSVESTLGAGVSVRLDVPVEVVDT
jgi:two-component system sensor histidine kinase UhpB